jgi:hypothetical protein
MSEPPARKEFTLKQIGIALANLYARLQPKRSGASMPTLSSTYEQDEAKTQKVTLPDTILILDELPVTNTITRRWPLAKLNYPTFVRAEEPSLPPPLQSPLLPLPQQGSSATRPPLNNDKGSSLAEDETEEMDALPGNNGEV